MNEPQKICPVCEVPLSRRLREHPSEFARRVCCSPSCAAKLRHTRHGMTKTPEWKAWFSLRRRGGCPTDAGAHNYYLRGIRVCERWQVFENFFADMGPRPSPDHSIDRIDNDGDYEPSNCRWATRVEQASNRRTNLVIEHDGVSRTLQQWASSVGINKQTLHERLKRGWPFDRALTKPIDTERWSMDKRHAARIGEAMPEGDPS